MVFGFELIDARSVADCAQSYNVSVLLRIRPAKSGVCRWCRPNEHISYSLSRCEVADVCDLDLPVCCGGCDDRNPPFGQFYPSNSDLFFVQMQALFSFRFVTWLWTVCCDSRFPRKPLEFLTFSRERGGRSVRD